MPKICVTCQKEFPFQWRNPETGKLHNLGSRLRCVECSPFGSHTNTSVSPSFRKNCKVCNRCKTEKEASEFYTRRNGLGYSPYCKICTNTQTIERQRELKRVSVEYKGGKCDECGYAKCQGALEFHHVNGKDFTIGHSKLTSFSKIKDELDKCVLLCANCHREAHALLNEI